jgi:hypothetical protein
MDVVSSAVMAPKKTKEIEPPSAWKCELCENKVTVYVILDYPPACQSKKHRSKIVDMVRAEKKVSA